MRRNFLLGLAVLVIFAAACGGGGASTSTTGTSTRPSATATRASNVPSASVSPRSGPPGTEITVSGSGWPAGTIITLTAVSADAKPYTTVLTDSSGAFRKSFYIEKKPDGTDLETGRLDLIATAGSTRVDVPFLVEVRRPVTGPGSGG